MKQSLALFQGRFQPVTIAHFCTVQTILAEWEAIIICVVYNSPKPTWFDPKWDDYIKESERTSYAPGKNPFTPEEVKEMWDACIISHSLSQRARCDITKRPYFDKEFDARYPPSKITLVRPIPKQGDANIDDLRGRIFPELLKREYRFVNPPFKLHNTDIIKMVLHEGASWGNFIPPGAYDVFLRIDGPARIETAYEKKL